MALTIAEADRIVKAVEDNNTPFTMLWQMRCDPQNQWMKNFMESGILGQVFQFRRRHNLGMALNPANASLWHFIPELNRDIWADDSAHPIDLMYWLFGMPKSITAEIEHSTTGMTYDNGIAILRYPDKKLIAEVACSFTAARDSPPKSMRKKARSSKSTAMRDLILPGTKTPSDSKYYLTADKKWTNCDTLPSPTSQGVRIGGRAKPMADFFHGKATPIATVYECRDSLRIVLASILSSVEGRRVYLDDPQIDKIPLPLKRGLI